MKARLEILREAGEDISAFKSQMPRENVND